MTAQVFRAVAAVGFRQVDHWEARPGGWLPLPEAAHTRLAEPVAHLVRALSDPAWASVGQARRFAARLSGPDRVRLDIVVRRVHRERVHAVSLDLGGRITSGFRRGPGRADPSATPPPSGDRGRGRIADCRIPPVRRR